jgi:hypothetical protein
LPLRTIYTLILSILTCAGPREDSTLFGPNAGERTGEQSVSIQNVTVIAGTFHWEGPLHLLQFAEGCGPQTLNLAVSTSVTPIVSTSTSTTTVVNDATVSSAVGFSSSQSTLLAASANVPVPTDSYARVEAYPAFERITWDVVGTPGGYNVPGFPVLLGTGELDKPVGIYFKVIRVLDCGVPGGGVGGQFPSPADPGAGGAGGAGSATSASSASSASSAGGA